MIVTVGRVSKFKDIFCNIANRLAIYLNSYMYEQYENEKLMEILMSTDINRGDAYMTEICMSQTETNQPQKASKRIQGTTS